ncbi:response regulator (plasmid) [Pseudomonas sp. HR96]|uniref:response regulator n=1 Tax=Pseudomonas sp. HR96 TaxID=1027966 RepID=UPI002A763528|nr:response regulator [Pseudomonas sp. HR96]WPP02355.1 response regulator [Pseudomonas sp. HR96]
MDSIIVVEDEQQILELMVDILEMYGYKVKAFPSADSAWNYIDTSSSELRLLITDLRMPGDIDGVGLVQRVHEKFPKMPIVVASGYHRESDSLHIDQVFWLSKPFTLDELHMACQQLAPLK